MGQNIKVEMFNIEGVFSVVPEIFRDDRGTFSETYSYEAFEKLGLNQPFVQDNHSVSFQKGVMRGLHFQVEPHAQGKLVRVIRGSILDVVVDLRSNSKTFGQHVSVVLSQENRKQLWIPKGFAHGFMTIESNSEVIYKVTDYYSKEHERGLIWNDPDLQIKWPVEGTLVLLSEKDRALPRMSQLPVYF